MGLGILPNWWDTEMGGKGIGSRIEGFKMDVADNSIIMDKLGLKNWHQIPFTTFPKTRNIQKSIQNDWYVVKVSVCHRQFDAVAVRILAGSSFGFGLGFLPLEQNNIIVKLKVDIEVGKRQDIKPCPGEEVKWKDQP